jgi:TRAP-type transport system small permease protein
MERVLDFFYDKIVAGFVKVIGIVMVLTILLQIFSRAFMKVPFAWTEELSRITFMWFCFLGSGIAMKRKAHLGIDYFVNKMSERNRFINQVIVNGIVALFSFIVTYYGIQMMMVMHKQVSSVMRIPMSFFYGVIPVTGLLFLIISLYTMFSLLLGSSHDKSITNEG